LIVATHLDLIEKSVVRHHNLEVPIAQDALHGEVVAAVVLQVDEHGNRAKQVWVDVQAGMLANAILDLSGQRAVTLVPTIFAGEQPVALSVTQPWQVLRPVELQHLRCLDRQFDADRNAVLHIAAFDEDESPAGATDTTGNDMFAEA